MIASVAHSQAGGHGVFVGTVRDHDHGEAVTGLAYEAHPSAQAQLERVCAAEADRGEVLAAAAVHRLGDLRVGDVAVVVAVAAEHRAEALDAARRLIDAIKTEVPIWKHQRFADGTEEWVGAC